MLKDIPINITIVKLQNAILKLRIIKKRFSVLLCATDSVYTPFSQNCYKWFALEQMVLKFP